MMSKHRMNVMKNMENEDDEVGLDQVAFQVISQEDGLGVASQPFQNDEQQQQQQQHVEQDESFVQEEGTMETIMQQEESDYDELPDPQDVEKMLQKIERGDDDNQEELGGSEDSLSYSSDEDELNYQGGKVDQGMSDEDRRLFLVRELKVSEETYLEFLDLLHDVYIGPIELQDTRWKRNLLSKREVPILFSYLGQIRVLSREFVEKLQEVESEDKQEWVENVCNVVTDFSFLFKLYAQFASVFYRANKLFVEYEAEVELFKDFLKAGQHEARGYHIESLMIMPIQRLPRYELFLQEISNLAIEFPVQTALEAVVGANKYVNETIRETENREQLVHIQKRLSKNDSKMDLVSSHATGRKLVKTGKVTKVTKGGSKWEALELFLFSDMLIYSEPRRKKSFKINNSNKKRAHYKEQKPEKMKVRRVLAANELILIPPPEKATKTNGLLFVIQTPVKTLELYALTEDERDEWVRAIREVSDSTVSKEYLEQQKRIENLDKEAQHLEMIGKGGEKQRQEEDEEALSEDDDGEEEEEEEEEEQEQQEQDEPDAFAYHDDSLPREMMFDSAQIWRVEDEEAEAERIQLEQDPTYIQQRKLLELLLRLITNEREYVREMAVLVEIFVQKALDFADGAHLKYDNEVKPKQEEMAREKLRAPDVGVALHSLIQLQLLHEGIVERFDPEWTLFQKRRDLQEEYGFASRLFETISPLLRLYSFYVERFDPLMEAINLPILRDLRINCEREPACEGQPTELFFRLPLERMDYYHDVLVELLALKSESDYDYGSLKDSLAKLEATQDMIQSAASERKNLSKLVEIQQSFAPTGSRVLNFLLESKKEKGTYRNCLPTKTNQIPNIVSDFRKLILEGDLVKVSPKHEPQKLRFFLFNDLLMYCKVVGHSIQFRRSFHIGDCYAIPSKDSRIVEGLGNDDEEQQAETTEGNWNDTMGERMKAEESLSKRNDSIPNAYFDFNSNSFKFRSTTKSFILIADSEFEKHQWVDAINEAASKQVHEQVPLPYNFYRPILTPLRLGSHQCMICKQNKSSHHCDVCGAIACKRCTTNDHTFLQTMKGRVCTNCANI